MAIGDPCYLECPNCGSTDDYGQDAGHADIGIWNHPIKCKKCGKSFKAFCPEFNLLIDARKLSKNIIR